MAFPKGGELAVDYEILVPSLHGRFPNGVGLAQQSLRNSPVVLLVNLHSKVFRRPFSWQDPGNAEVEKSAAHQTQKLVRPYLQQHEPVTLPGMF